MKNTFGSKDKLSQYDRVEKQGHKKKQGQKGITTPVRSNEVTALHTGKIRGQYSARINKEKITTT